VNVGRKTAQEAEKTDTAVIRSSLFDIVRRLREVMVLNPLWRTMLGMRCHIWTRKGIKSGNATGGARRVASRMAQNVKPACPSRTAMRIW
jgi:hypothetical protein